MCVLGNITLRDDRVIRVHLVRVRVRVRVRVIRVFAEINAFHPSGKV
jgi:hypothetical protein